MTAISIDWTSFSLGLAAGGVLSLLTAFAAALWRHAHYQEPIWKNDSDGETIMGEAEHLEP